MFTVYFFLEVEKRHMNPKCMNFSLPWNLTSAPITVCETDFAFFLTFKMTLSGFI